MPTSRPCVRPIVLQPIRTGGVLQIPLPVGLTDAGGYAATPDGVSRALQLVPVYAPATEDGTAVDIRLADGTVLVSGLRFGRASTSAVLPIGLHAFTFVEAETGTVLATLADREIRSATSVVFSGFLDPR